MGINYGKKFEKTFEVDWLKSFPNTFLLRLPDQQSGYFGTSRNLCDFIAYNNNTLFLLECKSINGNTFPLSNLKQYNKLITKKGIKGVKAGVVLWFKDHDKILYIPIETFEKLMEDNKKSYNIKYLNEDEYKVIIIPTIKKRLFLSGDYSVLLNMED